jgi:hypothetical protein
MTPPSPTSAGSRAGALNINNTRQPESVHLRTYAPAMSPAKFHSQGDARDAVANIICSA